MMQQDQLGKSFGLIIAFLIPGMVGLYAVSFYVPVIREWFGIAVAQSTTIGGFLFVIVASLGMGVFISGVRWLVLERMFWNRTPPTLNAVGRRATQTELVYQNLVWQFYDFYLFYANMLFAIVLLYLAWVFVEWWPEGVKLVATTALLIPTCFVLYKSARNSLNRFDQRRESVLTMVRSEQESA